MKRVTKYELTKMEKMVFRNAIMNSRKTDKNGEMQKLEILTTLASLEVIAWAQVLWKVVRSVNSRDNLRSNSSKNSKKIDEIRISGEFWAKKY